LKEEAGSIDGEGAIDTHNSKSKSLLSHVYKKKIRRGVFQWSTWHISLPVCVSVRKGGRKNEAEASDE
jgi:hypothetical protein